MKKVLIVTNRMVGGGAERVLQTLINHIDCKYFEITVCSMHREFIDPRLWKKDFRYIVLFDNFSETNRCRAAFQRLTKKIKGKLFSILPASLFYKLYIHEKYDVEIAFIEGESTKLIAGSTNRASKKIAWVHVDLIHNPWTSFLYSSVEDERRYYDRFNTIVCVSQSVHETFCQKYSFHNDNRICIQHNPIDDDLIRICAGEGPVSINHTLQLISLARLEPSKRLKEMLEICICLKNDHHPFHLHIVGDGSQREELREFVAMNFLSDFVTFHGHLTNPYPILSSCDVLISTSLAEGYSTVVAEALILGVAVVCRECAGMNELLDNGVNGVLVASDQEMMRYLSSFIQHPHLVQKYKSLSLDRGKSFCLKKRIESIERLIYD